jgi:hypothetical protein
MNFYLVDFYPKLAYAKKGLRDVAVRVLAENVDQAKQVAREEITLEIPELNFQEYDIEVNAPMQC